MFANVQSKWPAAAAEDGEEDRGPGSHRSARSSITGHGLLAPPPPPPHLRPPGSASGPFIRASLPLQHSDVTAAGDATAAAAPLVRSAANGDLVIGEEEEEEEGDGEGSTGATTEGDEAEDGGDEVLDPYLRAPSVRHLIRSNVVYAAVPALPRG